MSIIDVGRLRTVPTVLNPSATGNRSDNPRICPTTSQLCSLTVYDAMASFDALPPSELGAYVDDPNYT